MYVYVIHVNWYRRGPYECMCATSSIFISVHAHGMMSQRPYNQVYSFEKKEAYIVKLIYGISKIYMNTISICYVSKWFGANCFSQQLFHIPQCTIQNRSVHISVPNSALWDIDQMHCGIYELGHLELGWLYDQSFIGTTGRNTVKSSWPSAAYMRQ